MINIEPQGKYLMATVPYSKLCRFLAINEHHCHTLTLRFLKRIPTVGAWQILIQAPHHDIAGVLLHYKKHKQSIKIV
jgi:hypothetical protein